MAADLSIDEARRIALAAYGFADGPGRPGATFPGSWTARA